MRILCFLLLILCCPITSTAQLHELVGENRRIQSYSDLHADAFLLEQILLENALIDDEGRWVARDLDLVLLGDLVDKGRNSEPILSRVMELELAAERLGSRVHVLLGNHEILWIEKIIKKEAKGRASDFEQKALRWLIDKPSLLILGETLFVHGSLSPMMSEFQIPDEINRMINQALWALLEGRALSATQERLLSYPWGPAWNRSFRLSARGKWKRSKNGLSKNEMAALLDLWGASRVVVGHMPTPGREVVSRHPEFGERVVMIDTSPSDYRRGRVRGVELYNGELRVLKVDSATAARCKELKRKLRKN